VTETLRQQTYETVHDGMDLALVTINKKKKVFEYAGAFNPLIYFKDGEMLKIKADRLPIGGHILPSGKDFTNHKFNYKEGEMIYMFSDGYADQFGGEKGHKYMSGRFVKLLEQIQTLPLDAQMKKLDAELAEWMGDEQQVDDILVIGIRL
jgi:serine phosphatase RsbU (regulator of sigma subunit)